MTSEINQAGQLTLNRNLSKQAQTGYIMDDLHSATLLSAGQLCDDNCVVVLDKNKAHVYKNNQKVLEGKRNFSDRLWDIELPIIELPTTTTNSINAIIRKDTTKK